MNRVTKRIVSELRKQAAALTRAADALEGVVSKKHWTQRPERRRTMLRVVRLMQRKRRKAA